MSPTLDILVMAIAQAHDITYIQAAHSSSLQVVRYHWLRMLVRYSATYLPRPAVPSTYRGPVLDTLYELSHPIITDSLQVVTAICLAVHEQRCQRSKKHGPIVTLVTPDSLFDHVHLDIVCSLTPSRGYTYLLTCIDRLTRWPEAIHIANFTAELMARKFAKRWTALYGCCSTITSDRGEQFESDLVSSISSKLGTEQIHTTTYHPASNG